MPASSRGNWPKVAIGGLVLLNIVLFAALVLREPTRSQTAEPAAPGGSLTSSSRSASPPASRRSPKTASATSSATLSPGSSASAGSPERSTRVLAVNSDELAWRAVFGPCPTDPNVEVSRDGGKTWKRTAAGLRSVSRLRSYNESSVFAIGGAEDCAARYVATGGPNESWGGNEQMLAETWYRLPKEPHRVHAPRGRVSAPCGRDLGDFAGLGDSNAAALCSGGQVRLTQDSGRTWRDVRGGDAGLALGADDGVYALATRKTGCDGVAVTVLDPGAKRVDADEVRCAPVDQVAVDELAVSVRDRVVWLWAGSAIAVSTDRGRSWDRA